MRERDSSERTRRRAWAREGKPHIPGAWFEIPIFALYLCLIYKLVLPGVLALVLLSASLLLMRQARWKLDPAMAFLTIAYFGLATLSAFMVSTIAGVYRTFEFIVLLSATFAITTYVRNHSSQQIRAFLLRFLILNAAVLLHVLYFHLAEGRWYTWKYLEDTKFIFTALVFGCFCLEDRIRAAGWLCWIVVLAALTVVVFLSGERKAYLLLGAAFLISREKAWRKALVILFGAASLSLLMSVGASSPMFRQLEKLNAPAPPASNRYFMSKSIAGQSDDIRAFVNRNANRLFRQNPIFGVGATGYAKWAIEQYGGTKRSRWLAMNVHGELHRVPAENGLIGIVIVIAYFARCLFVSVRRCVRAGLRAATSLDRAPLYGTLMLMTYCYSEALDSLMLMLILLVGFAVAVVGDAAGSSASGAKRSTQPRSGKRTPWYPGKYPLPARAA